MQDYKSGKGSFSAQQIDDERRLQVPLYLLVLRDLVGIEPLGGVYRALSGARGARGMLRADARDDLPGFNRTTTSTRTRSGRSVETARERAAGGAAADPRRRRRARPEGRRVPVVVRPLADVPGGAGVSR